MILDPTIITDLVLAGSFGFGGGAARSLVTIYKSMKAKRKISLRYLLFTTLQNGMIGFLLGMAFQSSYWMAAVAGLLGVEILNGFFKSANFQATYVME